MRRAVRIAVAILAVAALAAGCTGSGGGKTSASDFAAATCPDLATWATAVQSAFSDLQNIGQFNVSDAAGAADLLRRLSSALGDADQATSKLASSINSRGAPNISSGDNIKKAIIDALNKLRDLLSKTRTEVDNFDVARANQADSDKFKSDLDGLSTGFADAFAGLAPLNDNNDLKAAFDGSASCKQVASQFGSS